MWKLNSAERLSRWRAFRKSLDTVSLETAAEQVSDFWVKCPYVGYYLDHDQPNTWPDPWTLVEENYWCDLAKALGMLYTIQLTAHNPEIEIRVYNDSTAKTQYNLVWINQGKYVLNYLHDEIVNKTQIDQQLKLVKKITIQDLKLDKIK